ncbi:MAG: leucyl aminopeptidase family protein [Phycisphaerales bacterium JB050]
MFKSVKVGGRGTLDVLVLGQFKSGGASGGGAALDSTTKQHDAEGLAQAAAKRSVATGEIGAIVEAFPTGKGAPRRIIVLGLGDKGTFGVEAARSAAASLGRHLAKIKASSVGLEVIGAIDSSKADAGACGRAFGESFGLLAWDADQFRGSATTKTERQALSLRCSDKAFSAGMEYGLGLAESANVARTLSETPPNICTPEFVAKEAQKLARQTGMKCTVIKGSKLLDEKLVGIHTVGDASENKPCLVRLEYTPKSTGRGKKPIVLVGKTITYDTGGLSLKISGSMKGMKRDMDGGAGVFGAMHAIATVIKPKRKVIAYFCCAENSISDEAYRPDDILEYANGVTVEVTITAAEGRLVLADGLIRACKEKPECVIDMATLTGGVVVALGNTYGGMWCDDDKLRAKVESASEKTGERVWRLPLHQEYRDLMKSPVADILNSAPVRWAHPIQGAAFLSYFVEEGIPWCHLDIAGVHATESDKGPFVKNSATGFGVRLLAELVDSM